MTSNTLPRRLTALLAVLVVAAAAAVLWQSRHRPLAHVEALRAPSSDSSGHYTPAQLAGDGGPAVAAAVTTTPLAVSYDYRDLPGSLRRATSGMTPAFAASFGTTFAKTAEPLARQKQAVTQGLVRAAGLVRQSDADHAVVLVYLDQLLVSSETMKRSASPINVSEDRVLVGVVRTAAGWRVSSITPA